MARPMRIQFEGALYHVTARGNERKAMVRDDQDRQRFLDCLASCVSHFEVRLFLFCLLDNHYHLVLETPRGNLSQFMQNLQTRYIVYFNRRHRRSGHLMQGRFGATLVEGDRYLLQLSRYVHLNPVHTRATCHLALVERQRILRNYGWSSYPAYVGAAPRLDFVTERPILEQVGGRGREQRERYRQYVETGLAEGDEEFVAIKQTALHSIGSERFQADVKQRHEELLQQSRRREDASFRRPSGLARAEVVIEVVSQALGMSGEELKRRRKGSLERAILAHALTKHAGLTQREVAVELGLTTGAAISLQLRRLHEALAEDKTLHRQLQGIDSYLLSFKG